MRMAMTAAAVGLAALLAAPGSAQADLSVSFIEGAPRDRFVIENRTLCALTRQELRIDLEPSAGQLFFDTAAGGAGSNVYGALEPEDEIARSAAVQFDGDGATAVTIAFPRIPPGATTRFRFDIDDAVSGEYGTMVDGGELTGAVATLNGARAVFGVSGVVAFETRADCAIS